MLDKMKFMRLLFDRKTHSAIRCALFLLKIQLLVFNGSLDNVERHCFWPVTLCVHATPHYLYKVMNPTRART